MAGGGSTVVGGSGSGGSGGGSADYADEAGHAQTAEEATHATSADHATSTANLDTNSTDWQKILRKDVADTAAEIITFAKGIVSTLVSKFKAGILIGYNDQFGIDANGDTIVRDISSRNITADGSVTAATLIANALKNPAFVAAVNMIGKGFGVSIDANGKSTLQTDDLVVLGQMIVNSLNIREVSYIGGTFLLTPSGSTVAKVMPLYADSTAHIQYSQYWSTTESYYQVGYRLMWKAEDGTTGTMNYWSVGDMAYCHTYNITVAGDYTTEANRHYWRLVVGKGTVTISGETFHYADVADIDTVYIPNIPTAIQGRENNSGSVPVEGDKVVCLGSMTDSTRRGAVQITAEGEASIGIYDGINAYTSLSNYEIHYLSKTIVRMRSDKFTWRSSGGTLRTQANFESGIAQAGIDIDNGEINLIAGKVNFKTSGGQTNPKISIDPSTGTLNAVDGNFEGTVKAVNLYVAMMLVWNNAKCWSLDVEPTANHTTYFWYHTLCTESGFITYQNNMLGSGNRYSVGDIIPYDKTKDTADFFDPSGGAFGWIGIGYFLPYTKESSVIQVVDDDLGQLLDGISIPAAKDYPGKRIEIYNRTSSNTVKVYAREVSGSVAHQFYNRISGYPTYDATYAFVGWDMAVGRKLTLYSDGTYWLVVSYEKIEDDRQGGPIS